MLLELKFGNDSVLMLTWYTSVTQETERLPCLKLIIGFNSLLISKCCYVKENTDDFKGLKYSVLCSKVVLHGFGPAVFASDL